MGREEQLTSRFRERRSAPSLSLSVRVHDAHDPCSDSARESEAPGRRSGRYVASRVSANKALVRRFWFEEGNDNGRYLNFNYLTTKPAELWRTLRSGPFRSKLLRSASMVVCEGANGWDDYLLLHHWDRRRKLDLAPMNSNNALKGRRARRARP